MKEKNQKPTSERMPESKIIELVETIVDDDEKARAFSTLMGEIANTEDPNARFCMALSAINRAYIYTQEYARTFEPFFEKAYNIT